MEDSSYCKLISGAYILTVERYDLQWKLFMGVRKAIFSMS